MAQTMTKRLSELGVDALMDLRKRVDAALADHRGTLEKQLTALSGSLAGARRGRGRGGSSLAGKKVPPKYKGPNGELWAGRGAKPRWLVAATKGTGKKVDDFLIDKSAGKRKAKR